MKRFVLRADTEFDAEDIGDAFWRLAQHFLSAYREIVDEDAPEAPEFFLANSEIVVHPKIEDGQCLTS